MLVIFDNCYATSVRKNKHFYIERIFQLKTGKKGFQGVNNKLQKWFRESSFAMSVSSLFRLSAQYDANSAGLNFYITRQRQNFLQLCAKLPGL